MKNKLFVLNSIFRRMSAQVAAEGEWLAVFRSAAKVLRKEGAGEFWRNSRRFFVRFFVEHRQLRADIQQYADETGVVSDIHPDDMIFQFVVEHPNFKTPDLAVAYYFQDGARSAKKLEHLLFTELGMRRSSDLSLLEFASGYGCVTRHIIRELAPLDIVSCDIHKEACSFIHSVMGVKTILSASNPKDLKIVKNQFDVVFALSFFSHMPDNTWGLWLKTLFDALKPGGYLIFTTHGMTSSRKCFRNPVMSYSQIWCLTS